MGRALPMWIRLYTVGPQTYIFTFPGFIYNKYPAIREQLRLRYRRYNEVLDYIDQLEAEGKAFVIRPQSPIKVGRTGSDTKKLEELYEEGYECGKQITQL